jgi:hypothetical protein
VLNSAVCEQWGGWWVPRFLDSCEQDPIRLYGYRFRPHMQGKLKRKNAKYPRLTGAFAPHPIERNERSLDVFKQSLWMAAQYLGPRRLCVGCGWTGRAAPTTRAYQRASYRVGWDQSTLSFRSLRRKRSLDIAAAVGGALARAGAGVG